MIKIWVVIIGMVISIIIGIAWCLQGVSIGNSSLASFIGILFSWTIYFYLDLKEEIKK